MRQPFCLRIEEIMQLDPWTVMNVYLCDVHRDGTVVIHPKRRADRPSEKEIFVAKYKRLGPISDAILDQLWTEFQAKQPPPVKTPPADGHPRPSP